MSYLNSISHQDWAITPQGANAARKALLKIENITQPKSIQRRPTEDLWGQPIEQPRNQDGVAIVPLKGIMLKGAEPIFKLFGFVSHDDVVEDLKAAAAARPRAIVLDVDSPGGTVVGTRELADLVSEISSNILLAGNAGRLMASAALYTAAGASFLNAAPSAVIGSIGTVLTHLDATRFFEELGIEYQQFASGKYKGMGHPGVALTQEQKEFLQNDVMELSEEFKAHMRSKRSTAEEDMEGQWFTGLHARGKNLVDANYHTLDDLLAILKG